MSRYIVNSLLAYDWRTFNCRPALFQLLRWKRDSATYNQRCGGRNTVKEWCYLPCGFWFNQREREAGKELGEADIGEE